MQERLRALGAQLSWRTGRVMAVAAVVTILLGVGLAQLDFATGQSSLLDSESELGRDNVAYQDLFGGENMVVLFTADEGTTVADLFTTGNLAQFAEIEEQLRASDDVFGVISPVTALSFTENLVASGVASQILDRATARETDPERIAIRQASDQVTQVRALVAGEQSLDNPAWVEFLLFENVGFELTEDGTGVVAPPDDELVIRRSLRGFIPNSTNALFAAVLPGNADLDQLAVGQELVEEALAGREFDNATVTVTGTPTFLADINDYLRGGMLVLGGVALLLMALALLVAFRVRWRLLPLLVVFVGILWTFGILGLIGVDLSLVTISGLPILIGIGIDFAIQMQSRIEEEISEDLDPRPWGESVEKLAPALATATIAAVVSFLVLMISDVPMIRDFGLMLSIGITTMLVVGVVLPTALTGLRERRRASTRAAEHGGRLERAVVRLGSAPTTLAVPFLALAVVVPVVGLSLESGFAIESDPINWADQSSETVRNARTFERETGFASSFGIFVRTENAESNGIFTDEMAAFMHGLALTEVEQHDELAEVSSLATTLSYLIAIPGTTPFPPTGQDMLEAYEQAPPDVQQLLVADDGNAAQINYRVAPSALDDRALVFADITDSIAQPPEGVALLPEQADVVPAGLATIGTSLLENLTENRAAFTYLALLLATVWLLVRLRNAARALLSLVPVLIAIGGSALLVAALGITLSPLTTVSGPLVIATCAEFTILIMTRYLEERNAGLSARESTDRAAGRTGRAFVASALTTVGGFGVLMLSPLPLLRDFGAIVTLNIIVALLSALVVLPPLIVWADERGLLGFAGTTGRHVPHPRAAIPVALGLAGVLAVLAVALTAIETREEPVGLAAATTPVGPVATLASDGVGADAEDLRPAGLVGGGLYDAYLAAGAFPVEALCVAETVLAERSEGEMLALGIARTPPAPEAAAVVAAAADACDIPEAVSAVVAGVPGAEVPDRSGEAPQAAERPAGLVAGGLFDAYLGAGAPAPVALCVAETVLRDNTEGEMLAKGIAATPPGAEAAAIVAAAAEECGVDPAVREAVANG